MSLCFKAISDLLKLGLIVELPQPPTVINPLSVSFNAKGTPRLVLDLRHVNSEHAQFDENERICTHANYKQLLDEVFVICRIINVEVRVISRAEGEADNSYRDIDNFAYHKTDSNNCFIIHFKWRKP